MAVRGVQEQKWNRNTSSSGLSKRPPMQRYEKGGLGHGGST